MRFVRRVTVLTAVFALAAAACGDGDSGVLIETSTTGTPPTTAASSMETVPEAGSTTTFVPTTTTVESTTTTTTSTLPPPRHIASVDGANGLGSSFLVEPGRYWAESGDSRVIWTISETVQYHHFNSPVFENTEGDGGFFADLVVFVPVVGVIPAEQVGVHPDHGDAIPAYTAELPDDLGEWIESVPHLVIDGQGEWTNGDLAARYWDLTVEPSQGDTFECDFGSCIATLVNGVSDPFVMGDRAVFRVMQFTDDDHEVYGWIQGAPESWVATLKLAEQLMDQMQIEQQ